MPIRQRADHAGPTYHVVNRAVFGQLLYKDFGEYLAYVRLMASVLDPSPIELFAFCLMPNHVHLLLADARGARPERLHASADDDARAPAAWLARHTRPRRCLPEPIQSLTRRERFVFPPSRPLRRAQSGPCDVRGTCRGLDVVERVAGRDAPGCQARAMAAPAPAGLAGLRQRRRTAARAGLHETPRPAPRTLADPSRRRRSSCQQREEGRGCL